MDPAAGSVLGEVTASEGVYQMPGGSVPPPGSYDFVVQDGRLLVGRGHYALSGGRPVEYAGEITFSETGTLTSWSNASGHFRPSAGFAGNANLPLQSFRAVEFPAMVGAPQVPAFRTPE